VNESTRVQQGSLRLLIIMSMLAASCGENAAPADLDAAEVPQDLNASDSGSTGYPKDVRIPADVTNIPDIQGTCDLIYPVLGCPCIPTLEPCCVTHEYGLDPWRWRFGYQCGHDFEPDSERVWEVHVYPRADNPCGPGFCDPASHHRCLGCPPFWPYYNGVNYARGPSHDDCVANPHMDGCPCSLDDECCVYDEANAEQPVGAYMCTIDVSYAIRVLYWYWRPFSDFRCSERDDYWECANCSPCDASVKPPAPENP